MDSLPSKKSASVREKAIEELVQGHEFAAQLQLILHDQITGTALESMRAKDLMTKMLRSFTEALSILGYTEPNKVSAATSPHCEKQLKKQPERTIMQETWTKITCVLTEDGYSWRKYGQKKILNAKHLRCYYRCTYRFEQGCQATKQVQKTEDEPPTFWTKYMGHHICQDILKATLGLDSTAEEGVLLSFKLNTTTKRGLSSFSSSLPSPNIFHQHHKKSTIPSVGEEGFKPSLPPKCLSPAQDLNTKFKSSMNPPSALPSTSKSGLEDLVSGSSSSSFDMDMDLTDLVCLNSAFYDEEQF